MDQPKKTGHDRALSCFLVNQFATPGLGSIMGRRLLPGIGQLAFAVMGFVLVLFWFFMTLVQYYNQINSDAPVKSYARFGEAGALVFAGAWVWALFTSFSLLRVAKAEETARRSSIPPRIPAPPPQNPHPSA